MATNKTVTVTVLPTLTGDTVASYNVYEGVSGTTLLGTMTVGEAAAGKVFAFTDGIVHSVKCQTVWTTAGASTIRSAGVELDLSSTSLFEDDFAGTVINTATKWNDNLTDTGLVVTQNEKLICAYDGLTASANLAEYYRGQNAYTLTGGTLVVTFDILTTASTNIDNGYNIGMSKDASVVDNVDNFCVTRANNANQVYFIGRASGVSDIAQLVLADIKTAKVQFKIIATQTNLALYSWNGSSWDLEHTEAITLTAGDYYPFISFRNFSGISNGTLEVDNFVVTDADYSTQYPTGYTP